jgi:hypothetical protein
MFVKVLAGLFATAVFGVGGFAYYHHVADGSHCCGTQQPAASPGDDATPPCCQPASRTSCFDGINCCKDEDVSPEVLPIEPREIK